MIFIVDVSLGGSVIPRAFRASNAWLAMDLALLYYPFATSVSVGFNSLDCSSVSWNRVN